jgi:uncharacterized protein YbjT (DUF2867 family)
MSPPVAVLGAAGRSGRVICRALAAAGIPVRALVRRAGSKAALPRGVEEVVVAPDPAAQALACAGARSVVSCAPAEASAALLAALPKPLPHLVLLGSTRRYSRFPNARGQAVLALERAFAASGAAGVLLYPTMIYGAEGENNVRRIAALARLGVLPLPGGGRSLIQPVHTEDVARAVAAAVLRRAVAEAPVVLAGPRPVAYADFVRAVAQAAGRRVLILPVPLLAARAIAGLASLLPRLPRVGQDEVLRLAEDKDFDIGPARRLLGFDPMPLEDGLALTFAGLDTGR